MLASAGSGERQVESVRQSEQSPARKPLCIDLFCGLGGWADGFLAEGYDVIGFDIERHDYGTGGYPGQLVLQDVLTLDGRQFRNAAVIVASPPCQAYSYRAMPWKVAKALPPPSNQLFEACFRIQHEANSEMGNRRSIPLIVENVKGAQPWVGSARWHYGSFYLWGDVPALMPPTHHLKGYGGTWFGKSHGSELDWKEQNPRDGLRSGIKVPGQKNGEEYAFTRGPQKRSDPRDIRGTKHEGSGEVWFDTGFTKLSSRSAARKAASAQIAKIPFPLAQWIAKTFKPPCQTFQADAKTGTD